VKPAEFTRQALLDHATNVFAERGFEGASVREITRRAETNQAAINYHFGGKGSLYLEVLKLAVSALGDASLLDEDTIERVPRDEAVRLFIRQQVTPLLKHGQISRYLRIFAWETPAPTPVYRDFIASEKLPVIRFNARMDRPENCSRFSTTGPRRRGKQARSLWPAKQWSSRILRTGGSASRASVPSRAFSRIRRGHAEAFARDRKLQSAVPRR
jgi:AcrR family transcriptional regulator